jgi:hypothetical protein
MSERLKIISDLGKTKSYLIQIICELISTKSRLVFAPLEMGFANSDSGS